MKNLFTAILFITLINVMSGQDYAVLRYGSKNSSYLSVGDTVLVPVYCDDITNSLFLGLEISLGYDQSVLSWLGDSYNPEPGLTGFNAVFPYNPANWNFQIDDEGIKSYWIDPMLQGVSLNSGDILFNFVFIYQGGETPLNFIPDSYIGYQWQFNTYLFDGCICDTITYPAIFHVTSGGNTLEGVEITIGSETKTSDQLGMTIFQLAPGSYSYIASKPGYEPDTSEFLIDDNAKIVNINLDLAVNITDYKSDLISVFPNPSSGIFYIKPKKDNLFSGSYVVTDIYGREIIQDKINGAVNKIDLSGYGQGAYFITVFSDSGILRAKLVVQK